MAKAVKATTVPAQPTVVTAANVPQKAPRYAPVGLVSNPQAVITVVTAGNPKLPGSLAHHKFGLFATGQTVAQYTQAIVNAGYKAGKAKNQIRWDLAHGFISLTAPATA